ncbi:MAG: hypothetical protein VKL20_08130 [Synechocystis sp.]|nr:hypothetical protein [Synechocystis sp.]
MIRQLNVFGTFLAFAVTLAITQNIPTQISSLPDQSMAIAQQSKQRAKLTILRSWHGLIVRQHRSSVQPLGPFSAIKLDLHHP